MNSGIYCRSFLFGFMRKKKPSQLILLTLQRSAQPVGRAHFQALYLTESFTEIDLPY